MQGRKTPKHLFGVGGIEVSTIKCVVTNASPPPSPPPAFRTHLSHSQLISTTCLQEMDGILFREYCFERENSVSSAPNWVSSLWHTDSVPTGADWVLPQNLVRAKKLTEPGACYHALLVCLQVSSSLGREKERSPPLHAATSGCYVQLISTTITHAGWVSCNNMWEPPRESI